MALIYGPWSGSGPGSSVSDDFWVRMGRLWLSTGVVRGELNELAVFADSTGVQVKVPTGTAWIEGQLMTNDAPLTLPVSTPNATNPRIDRVVVRKDFTSKTFAILVVAGTAGSSPVAPALTRTATVYDLALAQVLVPAAATTISASNITDGRPFTRNVDLESVQTAKNKTLENTVLNGVISGSAIGTGASQVAPGIHSHSVSVAPRLTIPAEAFTPATTNGPTLVLVATGSEKYELQYLDGASAKTAYLGVAVPHNYGGGPITVRLKWFIAGASQAVRWNVLAASASEGAPPDATPSVVASSSATSNGTSDRWTFTTLTWSTGLPTAGDVLELGIQRDLPHAADTSAATAKVRRVLVEFGS